MLHIPQIFRITGKSPSDCLVSYTEHSFEGSYSSAEVQSVYSTAPADRAIELSVLNKNTWNDLTASKVKLATVVEDDPKASTPRCREALLLSLDYSPLALINAL